jgi:hypothetical protein
MDIIYIQSIHKNCEMSISQITLADVDRAESHVLDVHLVKLSYIYGDAAAERLGNMPSGSIVEFMENWGDPAYGGPRPVYDRSFCHATTAYEYAWFGTLPPGIHPCDLATDMQLAAQFAKGQVALDTHDLRDFTYDKIKGLPADEIIAALANAVHARFAIEEGFSIPLEGVAALARVSDKTIRTAANPRLPGALKTTKNGNRTEVEAEDALEWLLKRPDFKPTAPREQYAESYRGDVGALATFLAERRRRVTADDFRSRLNAAGFPESTWTALESERLEPGAAGLDGLQLFRLGEAMELQSPKGFAEWVLALVLNARKTMAEVAHHADLVRINQVLASPSKT